MRGGSRPSPSRGCRPTSPTPSPWLAFARQPRYRRAGAIGRREAAMQDVPTKDKAPASAKDGKQFKWVGTRPIRPDGVPKVTGTALYGADVAWPGMLVGRVLRSPHAHARIRSINIEK